MTTISVLEKDYTPVNRPYSQAELENMRTRVHKSMRIGSVKAHHRRCNHFYFVKENGRKEKLIKEENNCDTGNCSVCWKLTKTPRHMRSRAKDVIEHYMNGYDYRELNNISYMHHADVEAEKTFYTWLYQEE